MNRRVIILLSVGAALLVGLCLCLVAVYVFVVMPANQQAEALDAEFSALRAVCAGGSGQAGAAAYSAGSGTHPIVAFVEDGSEWKVDFSDLPDDWAPATLAEAQLVACIGAEEAVQVERCDYYDSDAAGNLIGDPSYVDRLQYQQDVAVYEAQSGQQVNATTLFGTVPDECGDEVVFEDDFQVIEQYGERVGAEALQEWLRIHVVGASAWVR